MKRFSILILLCVCGLCTLQAQSLKGKTVYATVKEGKLKSSTWFFAGATGTFLYGDEFTVLEHKGSWVQVKGVKKNITGWTPESSVTTKQVVVAGSGTSASASELALAGKAWNSEVEKAYVDANKLDYTIVNSMETITVSDAQIFKFMQDGRLNTGEAE